MDLPEPECTSPDRKVTRCKSGMCYTKLAHSVSINYQGVRMPHIHRQMLRACHDNGSICCNATTVMHETTKRSPNTPTATPQPLNPKSGMSNFKLKSKPLSPTRTCTYQPSHSWYGRQSRMPPGRIVRMPAQFGTLMV